MESALKIDDLLATCAEILNVDRVDASANFFTLGGDSLAAARLSVTLDERWSVFIDLYTIMTADTIGDMYAAIDRDDGGES